MKIASVFMPWCKREGPTPEFACLNSLVRRMGHELLVFDINNEIFLENFNKRSYWKYIALGATEEVENMFHAEAEEIFQDYCDKIISSGAEVIIFKPSGNSYSNATCLAQMLKKKSNRLLIASGLELQKAHLNLITEQQEHSPFDYIICGQDEASLPKLLEAIEKQDLPNFDLSFKRTEKVIDCLEGAELKNLDELPFFDYSDFDFNTYRDPKRVELFTSRGCPWRCTFCISCTAQGKYRSMSAKRILQEILYQKNCRKDIEFFRFCNNTINGDIRVLTEFCDLISAEYAKGLPRTQWSGDAMIRPEMTKELLLKMHNAGCVGIGYGLESGSERVLGDMSKQFSIALAERVLQDTHRASIKVTVNIMTGFPTETPAQFEETLRFIERNKENIREIRIAYSGCHIDEGSYLYENYGKFGVTKLDLEEWVGGNGMNTFAERTRRTEELCRLTLSLGIQLMFNGRFRKKAV